ncbi:MAG: hypothetical protein AUJ88_08825 [Gallionellaceae bacterium CG1_02_56_997]|nr:MAG: hypothetical protein AUJ88_08825 [Gallionellaceae bacterium CG1_02_56_997]
MALYEKLANALPFKGRGGMGWGWGLTVARKPIPILTFPLKGKERSLPLSGNQFATVLKDGGKLWVAL